MLSRPLPTWLPWPLPPGWQVSEFGCVAVGGTAAEASVRHVHRPERPRRGRRADGGHRGARRRAGRAGSAASTRPIPAAEVGQGPPLRQGAGRRRRRSRCGRCSTSDGTETLDRSVLAGEALGRWLWLVLRPASAALLLPDRRAAARRLRPRPAAGRPCRSAPCARPGEAPGCRAGPRRCSLALSGCASTSTPTRTARDGTAAPRELVRAARRGRARRPRADRPRHRRGMARRPREAAEVRGHRAGPRHRDRCRSPGVQRPPARVLLPDPTYPPLGRAAPASVLDGRDHARCPSTSPRLRDAGIDIDEAWRSPWRRRAATVGRPHIADTLVDARGRRRPRRGVRPLPRDGTPSDVGTATRADIEEMLGTRRRDAGGVAVFAHPWAPARARPRSTEAGSRGCQAAGLAGIEVDHQDHDAATRTDSAPSRSVSACWSTGIERLPRHRQGRPRARARTTTEPERARRAG